MTTEDIAIEVTDLHKEFSVDESGKGFYGSIKALFNRRKRQIKAVDGINISIRKGEFVGYVGENGAGKSTTIKILTGILVPTSGSAKVLGIEPYSNRKSNAINIGVVFGQRTQLWWDLPVRESFEMLRIIYRVPAEKAAKTIEKLSGILGLEKLLEMPVRKLSLGQRMRCDIAAALIHEPEILFLDEPTIGLDVLAKENIRNFLKELNEKHGTTIILTTHDMNDIEELCERLIILDEGRIVFDDETEKLKRSLGISKIIEVEFHHEVKQLSHLPEVEVTKEQGNKKWLAVSSAAGDIGSILARLAENYPIKDISVREPSVESIIRNIYADGNNLPKQKSSDDS